MDLLNTSQGKAFDATYLARGLLRQLKRRGYQKICAAWSAQDGRTDARRGWLLREEIKAVTGHSTSAMVSHDTRAADKKKQATAAILKLENSK